MNSSSTLTAVRKSVAAEHERGSSAADREAGSRIVAILPRGEAIRNFGYSGALAELAQRHRVTVIGVKPDEQVWESLGNGGVERIELSVPGTRRLVGQLRTILDMAHGRRLWSQAAQDRWWLRAVEAQNMGEKARDWMRKLVVLALANHTALRCVGRAERIASRLLRTSDYYLDLYRRLKPALVFNGSHVHSRNAIAAVEAAQWLGIPTAAFIFSWDNLTSQGRIIPLYDHYLVWNEAIRKQLFTIYPEIRAEQITVTGTPQFDFHFRREFEWTREEFCARVGADPARPIVLYSTGMPNHMPNEDQMVEELASRLEEMKEFGPPQLLLRVYPKDRTGRFDRLAGKRNILLPQIPWVPEFLTPRQEDSYLLTNMLRHCACGVNIASTVTLELLMFDKPVINLAYDPPGMPADAVRFARFYEYDHYRPLVERGAVEVAYSREELGGLLAAALQDPGKLARKRNQFLEQMFGPLLDGHSSSRVASCLGRVAKEAAV